MSIGKKNKDNLKDHARFKLVPPSALRSDDPLRFWTNHKTENYLVDLRPFANGEFGNPHPNKGSGRWGGAFKGRPELIAELAPALEARCALLGKVGASSYLAVLRIWWRLFDRIEATSDPTGRPIPQVTSVAHLNELHEAFAHRNGVVTNNFLMFISLANDARRLLHLPRLLWSAPKNADPERHLITEEQARALKTAIKQDWEHVRRTWARHDEIRTKTKRREAGETLGDLSEEEEHLLNNWQHFRRIQQETGLSLPSGKQLLGQWADKSALAKRGLETRLMRSILFPTVKEADVAFHLALINSGWNPSTLARIDATKPFLVTDHPKDNRQLVLTTDTDDGEDADDEVTLHADKVRAGGKTQFCTGKKSQPSSAPMVVDAYLKRVGLLREIVRQDWQGAQTELAHLRATGADLKFIAKQVERVQKLEADCRSVWLYVDLFGQINSLDWRHWKRYPKPDGSKGISAYPDLVRYRLNAQRTEHGLPAIPNVTPADFRDIYARWVYVQTGGNILAVALALGHAYLSSTTRYLDNNIFNTENDEHARRFMTYLFAELARGRVDLTILAQFVRHGKLTPEMEQRLAEYRKLMRSRIGAGCADPRHPPEHVAPAHVAGRFCSTHRCLKDCPHATFLPDSLKGIAMRVEELQAMSDHLPRETWLRGEFQIELDAGEALLATLYPSEAVAGARDVWRTCIASGEHLIPGLGPVTAF